VARPQVVDGGDGLQIWRVAANVLNMSSGQPTGGGPLAWGFGGGLTTHHRKNSNLLRNIPDRPEAGLILWQNDPSARK
jgi:hypothetical protein